MARSIYIKFLAGCSNKFFDRLLIDVKWAGTNKTHETPASTASRFVPQQTRKDIPKPVLLLLYLPLSVLFSKALVSLLILPSQLVRSP